jgi:hypothetical protein
LALNLHLSAVEIDETQPYDPSQSGAAERQSHYRIMKGFLVVKFAQATLLPLLLFLGSLVSLGQTQSAPAAAEAEHVTGLTDIKENTKGTLTVENGTLTFASSRTRCDVSAVSIQDVVTGNDSQRVIRGTMGTLTMLAPYGAGRAISLLRNKIDTFTIQYRDSDGGLHGAIFTMPVGEAELIKESLLAQGAHTSIPSREDSTAGPTQQAEAKEQQR